MRSAATWRGRVGLALAVSLAAACAPRAGMAPFAARPDTVAPGDLRGPFEGQVVDADSGQPIEAAAVLASWSVQAGEGIVGPRGTEALLSETDSDGRYRVPRPDLPGGPHDRVERFTLVVYKRGYVAYRSDWRFEDRSRRGDFYQIGNQVRLSRLPTDVSHARHVAFVGAGGPLLGRIAWELQLAGTESPAAAPRGEPGAAPPDVRSLLTVEELRAVAGDEVDYTLAPLGDAPDSPTYASLHFRAVDEPEMHDAAIRVWRLPEEQAVARYEALLAELPEARATDEIGDRSLRAHEGRVLGVTALDRDLGVVLQLTCGEAICKDADGAVALARRLWARVPSMARGAAGSRDSGATP